MSLSSVVSRGVAGRLGQRPIDHPAPAAQTDVADPRVRFQSASMRILEAGLAFAAIAAAILLGAGR